MRWHFQPQSLAPLLYMLHESAGRDSEVLKKKKKSVVQQSLQDTKINYVAQR